MLTKEREKEILKLAANRLTQNDYFYRCLRDMIRLGELEDEDELEYIRNKYSMYVWFFKKSENNRLRKL